MVTNTEALIEAVLYASDDSCVWWEVFDTKLEATKVLNAAMKEKPDEHQIAYLLDAQEQDMFGTHMPEEAYINALKAMKKELRAAG